MPAATVLIPTHNHAEPLRLAVRSVRRQTMTDFELFIVGDGVGDDTRAVVAELAAEDSRIRFFDLPKGPRKGEAHRHTALAEARGRFVAYLGDDDIWFPDHLETLGTVLEDADFGHTMHVGINHKGRFFALPADLANDGFRERLLTKETNCTDMTFAGHTLDAYRRLPHGWRTTPVEFPWIDLYMWRVFLGQPWCRARSLMVPTGICTQTHLRPDLSNAKRAAELHRLLKRSSDPAFRESLWRDVVADFARRAIRTAVKRNKDPADKPA